MYLNLLIEMLIIAFDIGAIKAALEPKIFGSDDDAIENESVKSEKLEPKIQVIEAPKPLVQTAFQPSSTPVHLERRFMVRKFFISFLKYSLI